MSESDSFEGGELKDSVEEEVNRRSALSARLVYSPLALLRVLKILLSFQKKNAVLKKFQIKSC